MSKEKKLPLDEACDIAETLKQVLAFYSERIEIAGSIRREKEEVGDIEIVMIPKLRVNIDMFGKTVSTSLQLDYVNWSHFGKLKKNGPRYKQVWLPEYKINLDLFIVLPPAEWGVIFTIRTGDADFSRLAVTPRKHGGLLPSDCKVINGHVERGGRVIPMPEEDDFLDLLGLKGLSPEARSNFDIRKTYFKEIK